MRLKKLLTTALAGALLIGTVASTSAAELDTAWYAAQNPDVVASFGNSPEALKLHYEMFGKKEGRMANTRDVEAQLRRLFKAEEYAARYPDIKAAFGTNTEAMFQHYISYGLLEGRRPSEKVSQAAATSLKKTVEKAMADAGIAVAPGSAQLVEVITGTIAADKGGAALQQALQKAAPAIEKAVADTAKEAANPTPTSSGGSSSGGSSSSGSSSGGNSSGNSPAPTAPVAEVTEVATNADLQAALKGGKTNIKVTADITDMGSITVSSGEVNIDLGGHTLSRSTDGQILWVKETGVVTVKNGTIKPNGPYPAAYVFDSAKLTLGEGLQAVCEASNSVGIFSNGGTIFVEKGATVKSTEEYAIIIYKGWKDDGTDATASNVTVKGTLEGKDGITINGLRTKETTLWIEDATITATGDNFDNSGWGLYLAGINTTTIRNSTIKGGVTGIEIRAGRLNIESGTIQSLLTSYKTEPNNGGPSVGGVPLAISQHCTRHDVNVTVSKGVDLSTSSDTAVVVTNTLVSDTEVKGTVKAEISCEIPENKIVRRVKDGSVTVSGVADGKLKDLSGNDDSENNNASEESKDNADTSKETSINGTDDNSNQILTSQESSPDVSNVATGNGDVDSSSQEGSSDVSTDEAATGNGDVAPSSQEGSSDMSNEATTGNGEEAAVGGQA